MAASAARQAAKQHPIASGDVVTTHAQHLRSPCDMHNHLTDNCGNVMESACVLPSLTRAS